MLHVLIQTAACMLLISSAAQAGGYRNGRIRPVRDPAILSHEFQPVEPLPHEQLEQVDNTICLRIIGITPSLWRGQDNKVRRYYAEHSVISTGL